MSWSTSKLRWLLLGAFVLLAVVLAGFFGVARYKASLVWQRILARNGVNLRQETNGFTYSQSSHGRTVFTLHAGKAKPEGKNKFMLQDAVLILYGREPGRNDRIYGKQFEYDQEAGVARALGEVHMDLQTPEPGGKAPPAGSTPDLTFGPEEENSSAPGIIHVRTSGLVYMRKLGLAATGQPTEFRYGGLTCTSTGAEFDTAQNVIRLLADVHLSGTVRNTVFALSAQRAELNQHDSTARLIAPTLHSGDRSARAAGTLLHLRKDGSLQALEAQGDVQLVRGTEVLGAPQLTAVFSEESRPASAHLFTGVHFRDSDAVKPAQGAAGSVELAWLPSGALTHASAEGEVSFSQRSQTQRGASVDRRLQADQALASFGAGPGAPGKALLRQLDLRGRARAEATTAAAVGQPAPARTLVAADALLTVFGTGPRGEPQAQSLHGEGHTELDQVRANGARQQTRGDTLDTMFAPGSSAGAEGAVEAVSAVQTGHVQIDSWAAPKPGAAAGGPGDHSTGEASRAVYAQASHTLTLQSSGTGRAGLRGEGGELSAREIVLHQDSGDAEAQDDIALTSLGREGSPATHILAARARLLHTPGLSIFSGTSGHPARLWQGASEVEAAELTIDDRAHTLAARSGEGHSLVHATFASAQGAEVGNKTTGAGPPAAAQSSRATLASPAVSVADRTATAVTAEQMDYDDGRREAVFNGGVHVSGATGDVTADRGTVFLEPVAAARQPEVKAATPVPVGPTLSGNLDRLVLAGDVHLSQPERDGTGEQLTYIAHDESFVLTGTPAKPPRVTGEQGSAVTGATLLFRKGDSTIVVAGAKGEHRTTGTSRVHAGTDLR